MIPKSRRICRGAYRNVVPNTINDVLFDDLFGTSVGNKISTRLATVVVDDCGDFNNVLFYKRKISTKIPPKTFTALVNVSMGQENSGEIKFMSEKVGDVSVNVALGSFNNIEMKTYDNDDIQIGNSNTILGELNTRNNGVTIGDNNFLVDFKSEITEGRFVKGYPKVGALMFNTRITEYAGVGQTYVEFEDTSKVSNGMEIIFGSIGAGFVRRNVTGVYGLKVYFDIPLENKESTFPNALAFNEYYDILPAYSSTLSADVSRRSKRIFVSHNQNLHLRKVVIGGTFETTVFFMREADNMTIIKDMTPEDISSGTTIVSEEVNPYSAWIPTITQDAVIPEKYLVTGLNKAFIGRVVSLEGVDYSIVGFTKDTITFDQALPVDTTSLYFGEIDSLPSGNMSTSYISSDVAGNTLSLPVDDSSVFFVGQSIRVEGMSTQGTISSISGNTLMLDLPLFEDSISNKFYVGMYELPLNKNTARAVINTATDDLHTYIYGEEQ